MLHNLCSQRFTKADFKDYATLHKHFNNTAEVSWSDFKCFQAKGEGSYLKGNDRALSAESLKSTQETTQILSNSKIVSEFSGLCKVSELGVLDIRRSEASATFPEKSPQAELLNFNIKDTQ